MTPDVIPRPYPVPAETLGKPITRKDISAPYPEHIPRTYPAICYVEGLPRKSAPEPKTDPIPRAKVAHGPRTIGRFRPSLDKGRTKT